MSKEEKEATLTEAKITEPEMIVGQEVFENAPMVQMSILDLLHLVKRHLETGRVDLAVLFIIEAINQLEKAQVKPKNAFAGLRQDKNSPVNLENCEPLQPGD